MKKLVLGVVIALVLVSTWNRLDINIKPKPNIQAELNKYKAKEKKQTDREQELQRLSNPQLIKGQFSKDGKTICLESTIQYKDFLDERTYLGITKRQLYIDFLYHWSYWIDKKDVQVTQIEGEKVTLTLYQDSLKLYVMLDENNSQMWAGKTLIFSKGYTPEDTTTIRKQITDKVTQQVSNEVIYDEAMTNLKSILTTDCKRLGYKEVEFKYTQHNT